METKKTILIVDDDDDFLFQQKTAFEATGYRVTQASSRTDAMKIFQETKPDAVVLDLMMEEMDCGFILAKFVKDNDKNIPVVLVTAVTAETGIKFGVVDQDDSKWIKADVVLAKPVRFRQLRDELEKLMNR